MAEYCNRDVEEVVGVFDSEADAYRSIPPESNSVLSLVIYRVTGW